MIGTWLARLPLRRRVAVFAALLGLLLSAVFALTTWLIAEDYEHLLVTAVLEAEAAEVRADLAAGRLPHLPNNPRLRGWLFAPSAVPDDLPRNWAQLSAGVHEGDLDAAPGVHVQVFDLDGQRLIYTMDLQPIESLEDYLIWVSVLIIVLGGAGSAMLGHGLAARALRPVYVLTDAVAALPAESTPTALACGRPDDELRRLAQAIDSYQLRLVAAASKERDFLADASHELRSPIASLQGAVEVLLDDPELPLRLRQRIDRIDRAGAELAQLVEALMLSARGMPQVSTSAAVLPLLDDVMTALAERARARCVVFELDRAGLRPLHAWAAPRWLDALLINLLRVLIDRNDVRQIRIRGDGARQMLVQYDGTAEEMDLRSDTGLPLLLVRRLSMQMNIQLQIERAQLRLSFAEGVDAQSTAGEDSSSR